MSQPVDVQVTPQQLAALARILSQSGLKHDIIIPDVQRYNVLQMHLPVKKLFCSISHKCCFVWFSLWSVTRSSNLCIVLYFSLLENHKTLNKEANSNGTKDTFTKYHELLKVFTKVTV